MHPNIQKGKHTKEVKKKIFEAEMDINYLRAS